MKLLFAGDISFDWLPHRGLAGLLGSMFVSSPITAALDKEVSRLAGTSGLSAWRLRAQALLLGRQLAKGLTDGLERPDVFCANLECVLSAGGSALKDKKYTLQASPYYVGVLKAVGLTHVCLANNHILDFGPEALADTCRLLKSAGIVGLGLRGGRAVGQHPAVVESGPTRVALLNYVDPGIIDPNPDQYLNQDPSPFPLYRESVMEDIRQARRQGAVVVQLHWGEEWSFLESESQRRLARAMIDSGASAVISHHTHLAGAFEVYKHGLIAYGLGNLFMMVPGFSMQRGRDRLMMELEFKGNDLTAYRPIAITNDSEERPTLDFEWPVASLIPGYLPKQLTAITPAVDSWAHLGVGKVSFESEGGTAPAIWSDGHLAPFAAVNGKLPVGPGWRVADRNWTGVARSREQAGREFAEVCVAHLDCQGTIKVSWDIPATATSVLMLYGYPEYMRMLETVVKAEMGVVVNGRSVGLSSDPAQVAGWVVDDLSDQVRQQGGGRIDVVIANRTDRQAFCCFRLIAGGEPKVA